MASRILDQTGNLLRWYLHVCGDSDVPPEYHLWSFFSLLAATVGRRVKVSIFADIPLYPNLYVMLIGPSGSGKGIAINTATNFAKEIPATNTFVGKTTAQNLFRVLMGDQKPPGRPVFLVHEELANNIGIGDVARNLVTQLTELYTGRDYPVTEGTISRDNQTIRGYLINWLSGTTLEWLKRSIDSVDIAGGFFARIVPVVPTRVPPPKAFPNYPADRDEVIAHLRERLETLSLLEGEFKFTDGAREAYRMWVERDEPEMGDSSLDAISRRQRELILKLAMLLALCEAHVLDRMELTEAHLASAQRAMAVIAKGVSSIMARTQETAETSGLAELGDYVKRVKVATRTMLTKWAAAKGLGRERLDHHIRYLIESQNLVQHQTERGVAYSWKGRRKGVGV